MQKRVYSELLVRNETLRFLNQLYFANVIYRLSERDKVFNVICPSFLAFAVTLAIFFKTFTVSEKKRNPHRLL